MRILIAMDESDDALRAAQAVAHAIHPENSQIVLLHVLEPPAAFEPDQSLWKREEQAKIFLKNASAHLQRAHFKSIETQLVEGEPKDKIVEVARQRNADLIVLGSQGRTGLAGILLGSVAESVAHHADCSILIVRQPGAGA